MNITLITIFMFGSMLLLLLTGREIFLILGTIAGIGALALWGKGGVDLLAFSAYNMMGWNLLMAIPLFVFMGTLLAKSGVADKLFRAMHLLTGSIPGGLGIGTIGLCSLIAAMSGTNMAATVTAGTLALPEMLKRKYDKRMSTGIVLAGGALGFLIPPSVVLILYGLIARVSIGHLWIAAIIPGVLLACMYIAYIAIRCRVNPRMGPPAPEEESALSKREKLKVLSAGIAPLVIIFTVLGLLFMGVTSLVECSAIGVVGAVVAAAIHRRLNRQVIWESMKATMTATSMIIWIFMAAILFSAVFDGLGAIHVVEGMLTVAGGGRWGTMIMMQLSFFLLGMVLDDTAMLLIVAPLYIPLAVNLGFSPVWYGVLYVLNCQMAYLTPPFGYNLFVLRGIVPKDSGITTLDIYKSAIPFVGIQGACLALVMGFPQLALWLPGLIFG